MGSQSSLFSVLHAINMVCLSYSSPPPKLCGLSSELLSCTIVGLNVTESVRVRTHVCV